MNGALLLGLIALSLYACSSPHETPPASIAGVASKGMISDADVHAYAIRDGMVDTVPLASTTTGTDGSFTLSLRNYTGPLQLAVRPKADSRSRLKCDVRDGCRADGSIAAFGATMAFDFTLEALIPDVVAASTSAVSITPWTHIAAAQARSAGLSPNTIAESNRTVAQMLGLVTLLATRPVDVTDSAAVIDTGSSVDALKYSYLNAAVARTGQSATGGDLGAMTAQLASSYAGASANKPAAIGMRDLFQAALDTLDTETGTSGALRAARADLVSLRDQANGGGVEPEPQPANQIAAAKEMVGAVRAWSGHLAQVRDASPAFAQQIDAAMTLHEGAARTLGQGVALGLYALAKAYTQYQFDNGNAIRSFDEPLLLPPGFMGDTSGAITIGADNQLTLADAQINGTRLSMSLLAPLLTGSSFTATFTHASATAGGMKLLIRHGYAELHAGQDIVLQDSLGILSKLTGVEFDIDAVVTQTDTADPDRFAGRLSMTAIPVADSSAMPGFNLEHMRLEGDFNLAGQRLGATFEAWMRNAATFTPVLRTHGVGTYAFSQGGDTLDFAFTEGHLRWAYRNGRVYETRTQPGVNYDVVVNRGDFASLQDFLNRGLPPAPYLTVRQDGNLYRVPLPVAGDWNRDGADLVGIMVDSTTAEDGVHWRDIDATLSFDAALSQGDAKLPAAKVVIDVDRDGYAGATLKARATGETVDIAIDGDLLDNRVTTFALVATNKDSIDARLRLEFRGDLSARAYAGSVVYNTTEVGSITAEANLAGLPIVTYTDGSFESLSF